MAMDLKPPVCLKPDDVKELRIDGLDTQRRKVVTSR